VSARPEEYHFNSYLGYVRASPARHGAAGQGSVRSRNFLLGAFFITEAIPVRSDPADASVWLVPMTCLLAANRHCHAS
jgi:hypothetical protein